MQRLSLILHNDDNEYRALNIILSQEYFQTVIQNVHLIRNGILPSILFWLNAQIHQAETNDHHFAGHVSKLILSEKHYNLIRILPEVISNIPYINNPSMVQIVVWYQTSFNPLSEPTYCNSEEPSLTLSQCTLAGPVYTGMSLEYHWLTQCTLGYHWKNLVETAPNWNATGET